MKCIAVLGAGTMGHGIAYAATAASAINAAGTAMSAGAQLESTTPRARHYGAPEPIRGRATQHRTPACAPSQLGRRCS